MSPLVRNEARGLNPGMGNPGPGHLPKPPCTAIAPTTTYPLRRLGLWASADAAAVLAALLERGFRRTLEAADAALLLVTSVFLLRAIAMASFPKCG